MSKTATKKVWTKAEWLDVCTSAGRDKMMFFCGCDYLTCKCKHTKERTAPSMTFTASEIKALDKGTLFYMYTRCISDEMSPIMWRGYRKSDIVDLFLNGEKSVTLTPFI